jgi:hypothetical protein
MPSAGCCGLSPGDQEQMTTYRERYVVPPQVEFEGDDDLTWSAGSSADLPQKYQAYAFSVYHCRGINHTFPLSCQYNTLPSETS